ncbi:hypothetical protein MKZ38_005606 [Zalerion maritima]|uniref:Uncharacterized protein n=1 Tax=Zalerion maritima TaxID=339359 RepID=A0AAD5RJV1_9PEZI|nr:hypothetical protein MKZ38_005606 [Zalerion maritima]
MEAAEKNIKILAEKVLPQRPHQLNLSMTRRYRVPQHSEEYEEQKIRPLQYMTFVSEADRGVLYTRAYYDVREEDAPVATPKSSLLAAPEPKKKLSLKDYKNKKNAQASPAGPSPLHSQAQIQSHSVNPPPPTSASSSSSIATSSVATSTASSTTTIKTSATNNPTSGSALQQSNSLPPKPPVTADDTKKTETKPVMSEKVRDIKVASRLDEDRPRKLPPKPDFIRARSPSLEKRKRDHDIDDARSVKRTKPENGVPRDSSRTVRVDGVRSIDSKDKKYALKDGKSVSSPLVNGRSALGAATNGRTVSPRPSSRDRSGPNSQRPGVSTNNTPKKDASKLTVPPLLSPLHLSLMAGEDGPSATGGKKKPIDKTGERVPSKLSTEQRVQSKRPKPKLPPLLSPTLPPVVEQELARMKKTPTKGDSTSQRSHNPPDSPTSSRKPRPIEDEEDAPPSKKKRLVVTLKYKKKNSKRVQMILSLPPSSVREARKKEREREKERSRSLDPGPPPPLTAVPTSVPTSSQARKRPKPHENDAAHSAHASKRPRTSEIGRGDSLAPSATPSTPSKSAPAMARVHSNSSIMHTPGDTSALTPPMYQGRERSSRPPDDETQRAADRLRREGQNYINMGTRLKHQRDDIMGFKSKDQPKLLPSQIRRGCAAGVESLLAYLIGFKLLNEGRHMEGRSRDLGGFESLIPHLKIMLRETRNQAPMQLVTWFISAVAMEELESLMVNSAPGVPPQSSSSSSNPDMPLAVLHSWIKKVAEVSKMRTAYWDSARQCVGKMRNLRGYSQVPKMEQVGPWTTPNEVVTLGVQVLKDWIFEEGVDFKSELQPPSKDIRRDMERGTGGRDAHSRGAERERDRDRGEREVNGFG